MNLHVLTAGSQVGDVVFGIDNTFAARVIDSDALEAYTLEGLPESVGEHDLVGPDAAYLTPVDYGDVCVNVDNVWSANQGVAPPQTLADLTKPDYENLFVTPGAATFSPPATIPEGGWQPTTSALLDTCFRQVEYAGVLTGADNPDGAQQVIDWLLSDPVQAAIPDTMYVYPVNDQVGLPELWAQWAAVADDPIVVHPQQIEEEREAWLREWADIATG